MKREREREEKKVKDERIKVPYQRDSNPRPLNHIYLEPQGYPFVFLPLNNCPLAELVQLRVCRECEFKPSRVTQ